jgi:uncharacterized membrane protein YphA (DoxX/SURF4 family)
MNKMQKTISFLELYAVSVLRLGLAAVMLWFSFQQFLHNDLWTAYIPASIVALSHVSATALVYFNATFELVFGALLAFGWQTRVVALLLSLHLFDIMFVVGYGEIGARDFGLAVATFVIFMNGADVLCIQHKGKKFRRVVSATSPVSPQSPAFVPPSRSFARPIDAPIEKLAERQKGDDSIRPPKRFV